MTTLVVGLVKYHHQELEFPKERIYSPSRFVWKNQFLFDFFYRFLQKLFIFFVSFI